MELCFDIFSAVSDLARFHDNVDIYDAEGAEYYPAVARRPRTGMTVGADWKPALLNKAEAPEFYDRTVLHDNREPLPFADETFESVYSNPVYWVPEPGRLIHQIAHPAPLVEPPSSS